ncbi:hypothetical protein [Cryobacterium melibiosiphilum]|uniref:hypothetical protein n=1 Tax=Cryobacterium melibiosiphilum TaxID=995039 RepID=UPI0011C22876|nr:hypothetical protein [Cryobacterium melibiosiphilum]
MFIGSAVVIAALAFVVGTWVSTPESLAISAADTIVPVYVSAEQREVGNFSTTQGAIVPGKTLEVRASTPAGSVRPVVTAVNYSVGSEVVSGSSLASVSDRPLIVLMTPIPLQRDLYFGDIGNDVSRLQDALRVAGVLTTASTGVMNRETLAAIRSVYEPTGASAPGGTGTNTYLRLEEIVAIPVKSATVISISTVGDILADSPVATVQTSPNTLVAHASVLQIESLVVGSTVTVDSSAHKGSGTIVGTGPFSATGTTTDTGAGYDIYVDLPAEDLAKFNVNDLATVTVAHDVRDSLAIPLIAIRQDDSGSYVMVDGETTSAGTDTNPGDMRIPITVTQQSGGWAAIEPTDGISPSTRIRAN